MIALAAWLLFLLLLAASPYGEGGATPAALFWSHTALLAAFALLAVRQAGTRLSLRVAAGTGSGPNVSSTPRGAGWILLALAVLGLSALRAPYGYRALLVMANAAAAFGMFLLGAVLGGLPRRRAALVWLVVASALVQAAMTLWQWVSFGGAVRGLGVLPRPAGTFLNANHMAAYIGCGILLAWGLMLRRAGGRFGLGGMAALAAALAVLHAAFLLPASRGALAGLVAGYVVLACALAHRLSRTWRWGLAAAGTLVLLLAVPALAYRFRSEDPYRWERGAIWRSAIQAASEKPLLGLGPGQFAIHAPAFTPPHDRLPVRYGKLLDQTHSDLLRAFVEGGVAGGAACLAAVAALLLLFRASLLRARAVDRADEECLAASLAAAVVALLVHALIENLSERPALFLTGAALAGSLASLTVPRREESASGAGESATTLPPVSPGDRRRRIIEALAPEVLGACGLAAVWLWVVAAPYRADVAWRRSLADPSASGLLEEAIRLNRFQPYYHGRLAELELLASRSPLSPGTFASAATAIDTARRLDPEEPDWALQQARLWRRGFLEIFHDRSALEVSDRAYAEAERLGPRDPFVPLERGTLFAVVDNRAAAASAIDRAIALEPNLIEGYLVRARLALQDGKVAQARGAFDEATRRRESTASYAPENPYERQVLAWNETLAAELAAGLRAAEGSSSEGTGSPRAEVDEHGRGGEGERAEDGGRWSDGRERAQRRASSR